MKQIFRFFALVAMSVAMVGAVSCGKDDDEGGNEAVVIEESASYGIYWQGTAVPAGDTVVCRPSLSDVQAGMARFEFLFFNKTDNALSSMVKLEKTEGPASMNHLMVCGGADDICTEQDCPWTSDAYPIVPGLDSAHPFSVEFVPDSGEEAVYRLRVMREDNNADAQIIYFQVIL